jgi:integrase
MNFVSPIKRKTDINAVKRVLFSQNIRDYAMFVLGINTGLRIGDLLGLKVEDVLSDIRPLIIADRIVIREQKTGKAKDFPLNLSAKDALKRYLLKAQLDLDSPLFPSRNKGGKVSISRIRAYYIISNAVKKAGLKIKAGTHTMRKTFAYSCYKDGIDIEHLMKILNHSSQAITLRYIGIEQEQLDKIYLDRNL